MVLGIQQLSDEWRGTSFFDQVPRITTTNPAEKKGRLFIGGLAALYKEPNPLTENKITHVLSVLDFEIGDAKEDFGEDVKHLHIRLDDSPPYENLLKHFERTNAFYRCSYYIQRGRETGPCSPHEHSIGKAALDFGDHHHNPANRDSLG
ncbi:hypothetical protein AC579_1560 [Pseudocercospora musae]|uniref:Uncharacterized protein n=1 Tax=Pseudocercospora musae TaxID=113226 RepID=A0A139ILU8_9PEZI|nr:hypothetical protein AC579_1560 [Pseudocercospora musae]